MRPDFAQHLLEHEALGHIVPDWCCYFEGTDVEATT